MRDILQEKFSVIKKIYKFMLSNEKDDPKIAFEKLGDSNYTIRMYYDFSSGRKYHVATARLYSSQLISSQNPYWKG